MIRSLQEDGLAEYACVRQTTLSPSLSCFCELGLQARVQY